MNNEALQYPGRKFDNIWPLDLIFGRVIRQLEVIRGMPALLPLGKDIDKCIIEIVFFYLTISHSYLT